MTGRHEWSPERVINAELAAPVIAAQFPELAGQPVRAFDAGWDNVVLAVGDAWLFRFIHRRIALDGARRELAVLTHLADRFTVPIPRPRFVGTPTPEIDWPFWGAAALPGEEVARAALPDDARAAAAHTLGVFLRQLHDPGLAADTVAAARDQGVELPVDPMGRADPATLVPRTRERLARLLVGGAAPRDPRIDALLDTAATLPVPAGPLVLVHGDLHVRHVLVTADGSVGGVIDWGDTCLADPAVDLMVGYAAFVGPAREAFLEAYGDVPPERELRARALAVHVTAALLEYAAGEGMGSLATEARASLDRAVR